MNIYCKDCLTKQINLAYCHHEKKGLFFRLIAVKIYTLTQFCEKNMGMNGQKCQNGVKSFLKEPMNYLYFWHAYLLG